VERVHLKRTKRLLSGSLWVFSNELYESPKRYGPGSLVEVCDMKEAFLGIGYINPHSLIAVRLLTERREAVDREFLRRRILGAVSLREKLYGQGAGAMRLIYSEADRLPGLIADLYGGCLVIQSLTLGMEAMKEEVVGALDETIRPETIVLRNDSPVRGLEGIPLYKEVAKGSIEKLPVIEEDGVLFEVDPLEGQKTGFFLDQRENRKLFKDMAAGFARGGRALDLFSYTGAWALALASAGASVTALDDSERALAQARRNAELNGLGGRVRFVKGEAFSFLDAELSEGEGRYDFVVSDPPSFVKSKDRLREALRAYRSLNGKCMRLLKRGGLLAASSCSHHVDRESFLDALRAAGRDAGRSPRLLALRSQAMDHPVLLSMPETEYLKCAVLVVD